MKPCLRRCFVLVIPLLILGGLLADQLLPDGQDFVSACTWFMLAALLVSSSPAERGGLLLCLVLATAGEVFLSLVWGLYEYRDGGIPLFVPPGHVLLFWFGLVTYARVPARLLDAVPPIACLAALMLALGGVDYLSPALCILFLLCWWQAPARRFYNWMFLIALAMECYATWLGNWTWAARVPWLDWPQSNPPLAAGAFYCALDVLVLRLTTKPLRGLLPGLRPSGRSSRGM